MKALADTIAADVFNNNIKVQLIEYPSNYPQDEPRRRCPDLTKIRENVGYAPKVGLKAGLKRFNRWFRENAMDA